MILKFLQKASSELSKLRCDSLGGGLGFGRLDKNREGSQIPNCCNSRISDELTVSDCETCLISSISNLSTRSDTFTSRIISNFKISAFNFEGNEKSSRKSMTS